VIYATLLRGGWDIPRIYADLAIVEVVGTDFAFVRRRANLLFDSLGLGALFRSELPPSTTAATTVAGSLRSEEAGGELGALSVNVLLFDQFLAARPRLRPPAVAAGGRPAVL